MFREAIEYAGASGARFSGVLCGRATWKEGIPVYATRGAEAFAAWLDDRGVRNIELLNALLTKHATPWWDAYGGRASVGLGSV